jgi:signal transduction histidine kinase
MLLSQTPVVVSPMTRPDRRTEGIDHAQEVRAAQVRLLYEQSPSALIATIVNAAILTGAFWPPPGTAGPILWFLACLGLTLGRHRLHRAYARCRPAAAECPYWERRYLLGVALNGILWGYAGYAFFPEDHPLHQLLLSFVLGGMVSGSIATLSPLRHAYLAFLVPTLLPLAIRLVNAGTQVHLAMAAMVLLYVAMMAAISGRLHTTVTESLKLRFDKLDLLADLTWARDREMATNLQLAEQIAQKRRAQQALRQANLELEQRVEERTQKLAQSEEALREANRRKDEFLAMLGHELRNPLAPIRNAVEIMRKPDAPPAAIARGRDIIDRQVDHLARLVDDLLDVSRIVQGKISLVAVPLELAAVVEQAVEASRPLIAARRHRLQVALPEAPVWINGDLVRLAQVISNLLNNAAKYTDAGGEISLRADLRGTQVGLRIRDNGVGIPAVLLPRVFDLFTQADQSLARTQGGLGIGLTLVKRLVEMHGGRVEAHSEGEGLGSEFVVWLPLGVTPAQTAAL